MLPLRDLRFLLVKVLCAQRIMGFFIFITHKSTRSEKPITWPMVMESKLHLTFPALTLHHSS